LKIRSSEKNPKKSIILSFLQKKSFIMATNNKYDRQLRLWGAKGQKALGETTVLLVGASAAGTETLKNLVLPGVGHIHILDDAGPVTKEMSSSNFFLELGDTVAGKSRAQVTCELLVELNPDCQGTFAHVEDLSTVNWASTFQECIGSTGDAAVQNTKNNLLVVASDLDPTVLTSLSTACADMKTPLLVVHSYGLIGIVRLQTPPLALLDPKPTNSPPDLRLVQTFPKFVQLYETINWETLESHQHGHIPFPFILYKLQQEFRAKNGGNLPKTFAEKQDFRAMIKAASRDFNQELNFQEADQYAYLAYTERSLDWLDSVAHDLDAESKLGLLVAALQKFLANRQRPPLNGSIPDMTASTDIYVQLQTVYREQAAEDWQEMRSYLSPTVSDDDLSAFCSNIFAIARLQTRTLREEFQDSPSGELLEDLSMTTFDPYEVPVHTPLVWYMGFRACQKFFHEHQRYPGAGAAWEKDIPVVHDCLVQTIEHYKLHETELLQSSILSDGEKKVAHEMTRYCNAELHNIASVVGGVASQEAVKIITGQYIPLDNTYVFNGIASVGGVYRF
jgi:NEDD8-activating enzyme E1 regulatory subunit